MKRHFYMLALFFIVACSESQQQKESEQSAKTKTIESYNVMPRSEAFVETQFGQEIKDPFRWMETGDEELRSWIVDSAAYTSKQLNNIQGRQRVKNSVSKLLGGGARFSSVKKVGDKLFFMRRNEDENQAKLFVREANQDRLLVDPNTFKKDEKTPAAIHNYSVSPTGKYIAFHISDGGSEVGTMHFLEVENGEMLKDKLKPIWGEFSVVWIDDKELYATFMTYAVDNDPLQAMQVKHYQLGDESPTPILGYQVEGAPEFKPNEFPILVSSTNSQWEQAFAAGARPDLKLMLRKKGSNDWHLMTDFDDRITYVNIIGDNLYFISKKETPNGSLKVLDLNQSLSIKKADTIMLESDALLDSLTSTQSGIYLKSSQNGLDKFHFIDEQNKITPIDLPEAGIISDVNVISGEDALSFSIENERSASKYYRWQNKKTTPLGIQSFTHQAPQGFVVLREEAVSDDGTKVPITIYGTEKNLKNISPSIVYSYGGYGFSLKPYYRPMMYPFIEEGGLWVDCHVRGGGEKGRAWHEGGRGKNKPNGHADFIACAEHLIKTGRSKPEMIGGYGGSMGGVLVGPAVLKRPDLFGHAVLSVAILNPTRILAAQNGMNQLGELGDPRTEEGFKSIYEMDPYEWLNRVESYPDIMLNVGVNDQRVELWQSGKFAGRYNQLGRGELLMIRADIEGGHGVGSSREQRANSYTDVYTFMLNRSGHPDFQIK